MKKPILVILIISLSLLILLISMEQHSMNINNYLKNFEENNVYQITGKSEEELTHITEELIKYIKNKAGNEALKPHYNEKEILHMEDVQVLFKYGFILKYLTIIISISIIVFFIYKREINLLGQYLFKGMFVNWTLVGVLLLMVFSNFNKYFTYFHLIFFTNDLWILDPRTDLLIQMLPEKFFIDISIKIGVSFFLYMIIIQGIGLALLKKGRKEWIKK